MKFKLRATAGRLMLAGAAAGGAMLVSPDGVEAAVLHSARTSPEATVPCAGPVSATGAADPVCAADAPTDQVVVDDAGEGGSSATTDHSGRESDIGIAVGAVLVAAGSAMSLLARRRMT